MKFEKFSKPVKWMILILVLLLIFVFPVYLELSKQHLIATSIPDDAADRYQALYLFILAVPVYWSYNLFKWRKSESLANITIRNKWVFILIVFGIGASLIFSVLFLFQLIYVYNVYLYIVDTLSFFISGYLSSNYELI